MEDKGGTCLGGRCPIATVWATTACTGIEPSGAEDRGSYCGRRGSKGVGPQPTTRTLATGRRGAKSRSATAGAWPTTGGTSAPSAFIPGAKDPQDGRVPPIRTLPGTPLAAIAVRPTSAALGASRGAPFTCRATKDPVAGPLVAKRGTSTPQRRRSIHIDIAPPPHSPPSPKPRPQNTPTPNHDPEPRPVTCAHAKNKGVHPFKRWTKSRVKTMRPKTMRPKPRVARLRPRSRGATRNGGRTRRTDTAPPPADAPTSGRASAPPAGGPPPPCATPTPPRAAALGGAAPGARTLHPSRRSTASATARVAAPATARGTRSTAAANGASVGTASKSAGAP